MIKFHVEAFSIQLEIIHYYGHYVMQLVYKYKQCPLTYSKRMHVQNDECLLDKLHISLLIIPKQKERNKEVKTSGDMLNSFFSERKKRREREYTFAACAFFTTCFLNGLTPFPDGFFPKINLLFFLPLSPLGRWPLYLQQYLLISNQVNNYETRTETHCYILQNFRYISAIFKCV